jgi:NitT/TauT family transport system ATP-binding protein
MNGKVTALRKSFGPLAVIDGIDVEFPEGSVSAILGPSGCGKTTLLNLIAGLDSPDSGSMEGFNDRRFSYAFQEHRLLPWLGARDNILFALSSLPDRVEAARRADRFLEEAGLAAFADALPLELSGGMLRRLSLARAFSYPSEILLLDEAFSAVDLKVRLDLMELFTSLWRSGTSGGQSDRPFPAPCEDPRCPTPSGGQGGASVRFQA